MNVGRLFATVEAQGLTDTRRQALALQVADAMACLALAARTGEAVHLLELQKSDGGSLCRRAAAAAAIIRLSECDPIHVPSCLTPTAIVVPVAVLLSPDGETFSFAVRLGTAVGLWIAESVGGVRALEHGVWPTLLAAPAMASAAASVALGLDAERTSHAVALAISGSSGRLGRPAGMPSGRWLVMADAVSRGIRAASAAAAGFKGDPGLLGEQWIAAQGSASVVPAEPDADAILRVGLKPYVGARQGMNALAALIELLAEAEAAPVERVEVELPADCLPVVTRPILDGDRLSRIANLGDRIVAATADPNVLLDPEGPPPAPASTRVSAPAIAVKSGDLPVVEGSWPARVRMLAGGRWKEVQKLHCPGDAGNFDSQTAVVARKLSALPPQQRSVVEPLVEAMHPDLILKHAREVLDNLL